MKQFLKDFITYFVIGCLAFYTIFDIAKELKPKTHGVSMPSVENGIDDDNDARLVPDQTHLINKDNIAEYYKEM